MYYVYLLHSDKDGSFYTGFSETPRSRTRDHNWHLSKFTSGHLPYKLVWFCAFRCKSKALAFEKYLKQGSGFAFRNKHLVCKSAEMNFKL